MVADIAPYYLLTQPLLNNCAALCILHGSILEGCNMDNGRTENKESAKIIAISTVMSIIGSALLLAVSHIIG